MAENKGIVKIKKRIRVHLCSFVAKILQRFISQSTHNNKQL